MAKNRENDPASMNYSTIIERKSERELVVRRAFKGSVHFVFAAWTTPELFMLWWAPKSSGMPMLSCEMDVRVGGGYRVTFGHDVSASFSFFGKYIEVIPNARLVWTNEESEDAAITTVTFTEKSGETQLVLDELYPSKAALDSSIEAMECMPEQFDQLETLLVNLKI